MIYGWLRPLSTMQEAVDLVDEWTARCAQMHHAMSKRIIELEHAIAWRDFEIALLRAELHPAKAEEPAENPFA